MALLGLLILTPASGRSAPDGAVSPPAQTMRVSDAALFARELHTAGALRFYENTEDLLRTGRFEQALLRYAFLRGEIDRQAGYQPLVTLIDHRLKFLKTQLRLSGVDFPGLKPPKSRKRQRKAARKGAPSGLPAAQPAVGDAKKTEPGQSQTFAGPSAATGAVSPGDNYPEPATLPTDEGRKPEASQGGEEKPPETPPGPRPSRWQRLKERLRFWHKWQNR